jgi:two-component system, cell cycle sensor histidine kinase and response regulator CckA
MSEPIVADKALLTFSDLVNLHEIQEMQNQLAYSAGVGSVIIDTQGNNLTKPSNISSFSQMIGRTKKGYTDCLSQDLELGRMAKKKGMAIRKSKTTGIWNGAVVILIENEPIAYWLIGQARESSFSEEKIRKYSEKLGLNKEKTVSAYRKVPIMPEIQFRQLTRLLYTYSHQLIQIGYQNYQKNATLQEHRKKNETILENEAFLHTLISTIPDLLWFKNTKGTYLYCNPQFEEFFGTKREKLIGKSDDYLVNKKIADLFREKDRIAIEKDAPSRNEEWIPSAIDHLPRLVETIKTPVYDKRGKVTGVLGIGRDITKQKRTETENIKHKDKWQSFLDSADNIMGVLDNKAHFQSINKRVLRYFYGWTLEDFEYKTIHDISLYLNDKEDLLSKQFQDVVDSGNTIEQEYKFLIQNKPFWFSVRIFSLGEGVGFIVNDITSVKALEYQLNQVQRMDSIGKLAGGIAHDFNNMLDIIIGYTDLAQSVHSVQDEANNYLKEIKTAARKSSRLVRQLLTFAREESITPVVIDLNKSLERILAMLKNILDKSILLEWVPGDSLKSIVIDPSQVDQILTNLCVNARDALDTSGKIRISTENIIIGEDTILPEPGCSPGTYVLLSVEDNGRGMDKETLSHVFEPFYTTKEVGKGTGLGLSTVYGIMKQNGGFIQILSKQNYGTTMNLYFPEAPKNETVN